MPLVNLQSLGKHKHLLSICLTFTILCYVVFRWHKPSDSPILESQLSNQVTVQPEPSNLTTMVNQASSQSNNQQFNLTSVVNQAVASNEPAFQQWRDSEKSFCGGKFKGYANTFALMQDVVMQPALASSKRLGNEPLAEVKGRAEQEEQVDFQTGFLSLPSSDTSPVQQYKFTGRLHTSEDSDYNRILRSVVPYNSTLFTDNLLNVSKPTLLIYRYEFLNLYHTMCEWHAAFLLLVFFNIDPTDVQVLFVDRHPQSNLDPIWETLFGRVLHLRDLPSKVNFRKLIFLMTRLTAPMRDLGAPRLPLLDAFRAYVLTAYGLADHLQRTARRSQINATVILRKPYEPRRSSDGTPLTRLIANEQEVVDTVASMPSVAATRGVVFSDLEFAKQLQVVAESDLLVAMHGAGLTLALFLPSNAAVVETLPRYCGSFMFDYFTCLYKWRGLRFVQWHNQDPANELGDYRTRIPPALLKEKLSVV